MAQMTEELIKRKTPKPTQLLRADHKKVKGLFARFENAKSFSAKQRICEAAIAELQVHAKIEEEIFYPAVREHLGEENLLAEAKQEHHVVDLLIEELQRMRPTNKSAEVKFSAKFTVLAENVTHHIKEEEDVMFPKADKADMDQASLSARMAALKKVLQAQAKKAGP